MKLRKRERKSALLKIPAHVSPSSRPKRCISDQTTRTRRAAPNRIHNADTLFYMQGWDSRRMNSITLLFSVTKLEHTNIPKYT